METLSRLVEICKKNNIREMYLVKLLLILILINDFAVDCLKLEQLLLLSRHNVRSPYTGNLHNFTPRKWPKWDEEPGDLTQRGALLEGYMGDYFAEWMKKENLFPEGCPDEKSVFVYSNTMKRTKKTAQAFAAHAFPNCSVPVRYLNTGHMDPMFNPIIHNTTQEFRDLVVTEMQHKLDQAETADAFMELDRIIDLAHSYVCKTEGYCDLSKDKSKILFRVGHQPNVTGPLYIGNAAVDSFIMNFYDGRPLSYIAWGKVTLPGQWKVLTKITRANQDTRFNIPIASRDFSGPLLRNITRELLDTNGTRKLTLLVGHDSNVNSVISALEFKPFTLPAQYEPYPIGGKLMFQKWSENNQFYLKVEYVYQTWTKLRDADRVSLDNPPQRVMMELPGCPLDANGMCPWDNFVKILRNL